MVFLIPLDSIYYTFASLDILVTSLTTVEAKSPSVLIALGPERFACPPNKSSKYDGNYNTPAIIFAAPISQSVLELNRTIMVTSRRR